MRHVWLFAASILLLAAPVFAEDAATPDALEKIIPRELKVSQHGCGALLREDFNANRWGPEWRTWIQDAGLKVYCEDGKLRISGQSGRPVPVCANHHEFRFVGLVSKNFVERDVVMACRMQVLAPLPQGETRVRYLTHLCGASPDYFIDQGVSHEPDGRQGWFFAPVADGYPFSHDHKVPFISTDEIAADKDYTMIADHNAATNATRGFVVHAAMWQPLGEARVFMSTTQVELKVDVPYDGVRVDVAFDDARLYLRPETVPVRFVLLKPPFPYFPFAGAILQFTDPDGKAIGQAQTNPNGEATITLPPDRLYPMGGRVSVTAEGKQIGVATINAGGVEGLYPNDVWVILAPDEFAVTDRGYPMGM